MPAQESATHRGESPLGERGGLGQAGPEPQPERLPVQGGLLVPERQPVRDVRLAPERQPVQGGRLGLQPRGRLGGAPVPERHGGRPVLGRLAPERRPVLADAERLGVAGLRIADRTAGLGALVRIGSKLGSDTHTPGPARNYFYYSLSARAAFFLPSVCVGGSLPLGQSWAWA